MKCVSYMRRSGYWLGLGFRLGLGLILGSIKYIHSLVRISTAMMYETP